MNTTRRTALITGASAGIGATFARHLANEGYDVLLVARRAERLEELAAQLHQQHDVRAEVFTADLADPTAPAAIIARATELGLPIDVLINNAGLMASVKFSDGSWDSVAAELHSMVTAVTELIHRAIPGMKQRGWGRIINLSSLDALAQPGEGLLYTGIKLSQCFDMELKPHRIHVTALCPGFTHTEFHDVTDNRDAADRLPSFMWQQPDPVVRRAGPR